MRTKNHTRSRLARVLTATLFLTTAGAACATEPKARPTALDPSNPDAPESHAQVAAAAPTPQSSEKTGTGKAPQADKAAPEKAPASATLYTCPMHPEVISDKPGRCPKCGMKLVPKEPPPSDKK